MPSHLTSPGLKEGNDSCPASLHETIARILDFLRKHLDKVKRGLSGQLSPVDHHHNVQAQMSQARRDGDERVCVSALPQGVPQHSVPVFHGLGLSVGFHRLCLYSGGESTGLDVAA